jgi:uncharacterized membrane protein
MTVTGILALLVASPALSRLLVLPRTEFFTELGVLGPSHTAANYPYNISRNHNYSISLEIRNHLGCAAYYLVEVKFRNLTQSASNSSTPSSLMPLYNITAFVADEGVLEIPINFSFNYGYNATFRRIDFYNLALNDVVLDMRGYTVAWDSVRRGFFGNLFFELWLYKTSSQSFQFHNRSVWIWLNISES